jgi:hypothetical protein
VQAVYRTVKAPDMAGVGDAASAGLRKVRQSA